MRFGTELLRQSDVLAQFTEDAPRLTRTYLSPQHKEAGTYLISLMKEAGMSAGFDALGNIVGRYDGAEADAPIVMTGSHQDSVRNAGKYDGLFGIITAIACVKDLNTRGVHARSRRLRRRGRRALRRDADRQQGDGGQIRPGVARQGRRQRHHDAAGARRVWRRPRSLARRRSARQERRRLRRVAHRAGSGAVERRASGGCGHRDCRRIAAQRQGHRPRGARRYGADGRAARRAGAAPYRRDASRRAGARCRQQR